MTDQHSMTVTLMSFGFKHGAPEDADIVMDVRFLQNPHWVDGLKPMSGLDADVGAYIRDDEAFEDFIKHFRAMIALLLPRYAKTERETLTIAIGCTGGRHRSVFAVKTLEEWFNTQECTVRVVHRDLDVLQK